MTHDPAAVPGGATLTIKTVSTLQDFTTIIEEEVIAGGADDPLWYRGVKARYDLKPSLFRHPSVDPALNPSAADAEKLFELEAKLLTRFKERSLPYHSQRIQSDWEYLFFMQHFGIPTRLLDWSENPFMGLFFALTNINLKAPEDAAVWILRPHSWNHRVLHHIRFNKGILSNDHPTMQHYQPNALLDTMGSDPLAMWGVYNSPRIVAQRGVFTVFGKDVRAMEEIYKVGGYPQDTLMKIVVPKDAVAAMLQSLISIGITDSVVYPDLSGLASETKRFFGFVG